MITRKDIQETEIYLKLDPVKDFIKLKFINNLSIQKTIINAYTVAKNTGTIPDTVSGIYKEIVIELLNTK